ncbi:hypothetical protein ACVMAJ_000980 [Bradyrhizobium sp. USDA 4448]
MKATTKSALKPSHSDLIVVVDPTNRFTKGRKKRVSKVFQSNLKTVGDAIKRGAYMSTVRTLHEAGQIRLVRIF